MTNVACVADRLLMSISYLGFLFFVDRLRGSDSPAFPERNSPNRSSRASHAARRSLIQCSAAVSASGSISHVRTRPALCERTTPLCSRTCRCWTTAGSEIDSGRASSLTDAGPSSSRSIIALRFASESAWKTTSTGGSAREGEYCSTHPFEQAGRLFAHNGVIEDLPKLDAQLGEDLSLVHGDTDSERFFAQITREAAAHGGDIGEGILRACEWVAQNLPVFAMNFVLATADELFALRYPQTHELYVLERVAGAELEHESSFGTRVVSDHGSAYPLVTIASERMDDDPGWRL